jgi:CRISPR-associated protein Cas1
MDEELANIDKVMIGDETNVEATFSVKYFKTLFGANFERLNYKDRNKMDQYSEYVNFVNSYLNYGYTILMAMFARSIVKNGYDTRISIFHKSFSNHTALASDLMEPFRTVVDASVFNTIREIKKDALVLDSTIKRKIVDIFLKDIIYNNERINIFNAIDKFVNDILKQKHIKIEYLYENY